MKKKIYYFILNIIKQLIKINKYVFQGEKVATGQKRHTPITFGSDGNSSKRIREENRNTKRELYTPPSGKYSSNISSNYGKIIFTMIDI